jgi:hypothetical protein
MIGRISAALHARRAAIRESDELVGAFGQRGFEMAEGFAVDQNRSVIAVLSGRHRGFSRRSAKWLIDEDG